MILLRFGHSGFLVLWALNFVGMLSVGLALESVYTILTHRFMPYFLFVWIISEPLSLLCEGQNILTSHRQRIRELPANRCSPAFL